VGLERSSFVVAVIGVIATIATLLFSGIFNKEAHDWLLSHRSTLVTGARGEHGGIVTPLPDPKLPAILPAHIAEAGVPLRLGELSMVMKDCRWTLSNPDRVEFLGCEGKATNESDHGLEVTVDDGASAVDDQGNAYRLTNWPMPLGNPGLVIVEAGDRWPRELVPRVPVKFGFAVLGGRLVTRDVASFSFIFRVSTSPNNPGTLVTFRHIPMEGG